MHSAFDAFGKDFVAIPFAPGGAIENKPSQKERSVTTRVAGFDYDMLVIGSGPSGQRAAVQAAKLGQRTMLVECKAVIGGVCINTGTIPSKTLRQAVLHLSGYREREIYGSSYAVKQNVTMADLHVRTDHVIRHELDVTRHQLQRNQIEVSEAAAQFVDPHTINLTFLNGHGQQNVTAANIVIAAGTRATRDSHIPFDAQRIFISDDILALEHLPRSLAVVGAGVIGGRRSGQDPLIERKTNRHR